MLLFSGEISRFASVAIVFVILFFARAQEAGLERQIEPMDEEGKMSANSETAAEKLFKKLFVERRKEHLEAVRSLQKIESYEKLYKMIKILVEKVIDVIGTSKNLLEDLGFSPDNNSFPQDMSIKDALANVLENTALVGDIVLHLPNITHKILKMQQKWDQTIKWSVNFAEKAEHLLDQSTIKMLKLLAQELNITNREPGYFNPYWDQPIASNIIYDTSKKSKRALDKKRKKEPRMQKIEL